MKLHLLPQPRKVTVLDEALSVPVSALDNVNATVGGGSVTHSEGYRMEIGASGVRIEAADEAGRFYAQCTLKQILQQARRHGGAQPLVIEDWPALPLRLLHLDMSRDRIPTMAELKRQLDMAASWKINMVTLYFEHVYAFSDEDVWRGETPFTADELQDLRLFCKARFMRLFPTLESFGHLHRWLRLDKYRPLAECPEGWPSSWALDSTDPFSLCPTDPKSIEFVDNMWAEFLPNFDDELFCVCCDETADLGKGRSKEACEKHGVGRVFLDFVKKLCDLAVTKYHRTPIVDTDIVHLHPEIAGELPHSCVLLDWGYRPDFDFEGHAKHFNELGYKYILLGSNSSYTCFNGRTYRWRENIDRMVDAAVKYGALGVGNSEWGDNGHWNELVTAIPGDAYFAAMSWCPESNREADLAGALDEFVFEPESGAAALLMDCGRPYIHFTDANGSDNLWLFLMGGRHSLTKLTEEQPLTEEDLFRIQADLRDVLFRLERAKGFAPRDLDGLRLRAEWMRLVAEVAQECLAAGKTLGKELPLESRKGYAARYDVIAKGLVAQRDDGTFREGGRDDAIAWLRRFRDELCGEV